jgi:protein gp37
MLVIARSMARMTEQLALKLAEQRRLADCEGIIERGLATFIEVGEALLCIRDERLYRAEHRTFEDYCRERWGFSRQRGLQLIDAAEMTTTVVTAGLPAPTSERQARELAPLRDEPEQMSGAWQDAVAEHGDRPTAAQVREHVAPRRNGAARPTEPTFNQVNDNIGWARWSWNPVTGCKHDCAYCYARDIANRFYPEGFEPTFHPKRLSAPQHTKIPRAAGDDPAWCRVFTCSMADLFGKWVPQEWIDAVFEQIVAAPQWEFLCLTKFPQRLAQFDWPDNAWVGTTVDKQHRVALAQRHFANVQAGVKWLSCEPLLEPLKFDSLEMFDWVVIGACTKSAGAPAFAPEWDWVVDLYQQARAAGCKVYLKHNLMLNTEGVAPGIVPVREWPR